MRRAASLHADRARLDVGEEFDDPGTAQFAFRGGTIFALQRVDLKVILGDVDANSDIFPHGRPPSWWRSSNHLSALDAPTVGPSTSSRVGALRGVDAFGRLRSLLAGAGVGLLSWGLPGLGELELRPIPQHRMHHDCEAARQSDPCLAHR